MKKESRVAKCLVIVLLLAACRCSPIAPDSTAQWSLASPTPGGESLPYNVQLKMRETDDAEMVLVPSGEFLMGSDSDDNTKQSPQHTVYVGAFWIDRTEVTNGQYNRCVDAGACSPSACADDTRFNDPRQPVVCVTWHDAVQYASWVGGRLPTEAEWEKAARGTDGRRYPWGDQFDSERANTSEGRILRTTPVGQYSPQGDSPFGVVDMAGNVYEWTSTVFNEYPYDADDGREAAESTRSRVLRGGSFLLNQNAANCAARVPAGPEGRSISAGFRVAVSADSQD